LYLSGGRVPDKGCDACPPQPLPASLVCAGRRQLRTWTSPRARSGGWTRRRMGMARRSGPTSPTHPATRWSAPSAARRLHSTTAFAARAARSLCATIAASFATLATTLSAAIAAISSLGGTEPSSAMDANHGTSRGGPGAPIASIARAPGTLQGTVLAAAGASVTSAQDNSGLKCGHCNDLYCSACCEKHDDFCVKCCDRDGIFTCAECCSGGHSDSDDEGQGDEE